MMMDNVHLDMRLSIVLIIIDMRRTQHTYQSFSSYFDIDEKRRWRTTTTTICSLYNASFFFWPVVRQIKLPTEEICQDKRFAISFVCALLSRLTKIGKSNSYRNSFLLLMLSKRVHAEIDFIQSKMDVLWALSNTHTRMSILSFFIHQWRNPISFSICVFTHARTNERWWRVYRAANWKINEANIFKQPPHCYSHCWTNEIDERHQQ